MSNKLFFALLSIATLMGCAQEVEQLGPNVIPLGSTAWSFEQADKPSIDVATSLELHTMVDGTEMVLLRIEKTVGDDCHGRLAMGIRGQSMLSNDQIVPVIAAGGSPLHTVKIEDLPLACTLGKPKVTQITQKQLNSLEEVSFGPKAKSANPELEKIGTPLREIQFHNVDQQEQPVGISWDFDKKEPGNVIVASYLFDPRIDIRKLRISEKPERVEPVGILYKRR